MVSEEKSLEILDERMSSTTEPAYTLSSPGIFGAGKLNKKLKGQPRLIIWAPWH